MENIIATAIGWAIWVLAIILALFCPKSFQVIIANKKNINNPLIRLILTVFALIVAGYLYIFLGPIISFLGQAILIPLRVIIGS